MKLVDCIQTTYSWEGETVAEEIYQGLPPGHVFAPISIETFGAEVHESHYYYYYYYYQVHLFTVL